jgi:hypothetical protein
MRLHLAIAYRRLSALRRDKLVGSHAVASSRDLLACALFTTNISQTHPLRSCLPSSSLHTSPLPDDDTCYLHSYYQPTFQTSTSILAHSKRGIHRRPPPQSPKQTAIGIRESHSPTIKSTATRHSTTRQSSSQLSHAAIHSRNITPKPFSDHWSQNPATA